jgi:hypothetical protein
MSQTRKDIYWQFAELTEYRYLRSDNADANGYVQTLVELQPGRSAEDLHQWLRAQTPSAAGFVPPHYRALPNRFCAAWIAPGALSQLPSDLISRFKLGLPTNPNAFFPLGAVDAHQERNTESGAANNAAAQALLGGPVVGIIDDHIDSTGVLGTSSMRLLANWDQNAAPGHNPAVLRFGYGLPPDGLRSKPTAVSHGSLVASIAAGAITPQYRSRQTLKPVPAKTDAASAVPVMTVQLRQDTVIDTSGGALAVNVLDGLHFMLTQLPPQAKLVANISFGTMAGAHDGTSILEQAMAELLASMPGRLQIVLPAGNARQSQAHARLQLEPAQQQALIWRVLPDDRTPSYVEIWASPDARLQVTLTAPDGRSSIHCVSGQASATLKRGSDVIGALIANDTPASSMTQQVVLVAIAPTRTEQAPAAPHGDWTIQIKNTGANPTDINAWIERDNASFGQRSRGRQSYFVEPQWPRQRHRLQTGLPASAVCEEGTLNGIATGAGITVVGGYRLSDGKAAAYSGLGSASIRAPDTHAPSDESALLRGIVGSSNSGSGVARLSGTSAAAPWHTRERINQLAQLTNAAAGP